MMLKTINITLGVLVAFSVWCVALLIAAFVAIVTLHVLAIGGLTTYYLMHS